MPHSRLTDPGYKNWVTVGRAIQITRNGLEAIVQNAVDKYHNSLLLLASLPNNIPAWATYLKKAHRSHDKRKIAWDNSDNTQWFTASWEIAKIFMAPLGPRKLDVVDSQTSDISGLLNVLEWSPRGPNGIFNTGVSLAKIADARNVRNIWAHAPLLQISDTNKAKTFASLISLLQDPELYHDKDAQYAINELNKLLKDGLVVIEENELEILIDLQRQLGQDMVCLKSHIDGWKDQVEPNVEQIQDQRKFLDQFVKKNELQKALETVEKKINDIEEEIIQVRQSTNIRLEKLEEKATAEPQYSVDDNKSSLRFNPVSDRMKEEFVGREWLFNTIDRWLEKDLGPRESRAFVIWGGPGTGKSSFARELVRRHEGEKLAGYHYCQNDNPLTCNLKSLAHNLSRMLSASLPEYSALVGPSSLQSTIDEFRDHPEELFDALITTPLQQLQENANKFLVIDGLDEGGSTIASCFARLSAKLPSFLRVILTARHDAPALSNLFPDSNFACLDRLKDNLQSLFSKDVNIDEDIREFVTMKCKKLQSEYLTIPSFFSINEQEAMRRIVYASENCFLYAKLVMEHIFAGHDEIGLPTTLSEIYCMEFRRRFPDVEFFEKNIAPKLEVFIAIRQVNAKISEGMFVDELFAKGLAVPSSERVAEMVNNVVKFTDKYQFDFIPGSIERGVFSKRDLNKALKLLSGYLTKDLFSSYCFSHNSVSEWLQEEKSEFFCDAINGHSTVATYCLRALKKNLQHVNPNSDKSILLSAFSYLFTSYIFHSSYLPESEITPTNALISELSIGAIDILDMAMNPWKGVVDLIPAFVVSEYVAIKILDETDILTTMSLKEKADHLLTAIEVNCASIVAKFVDSAYWIFSSEVIFAMINREIIDKCLEFARKKVSLPQLLFSSLCSDFTNSELNAIFEFCVGQGVTMDVCVPRFFKNVKNFDASVCWNEDVHEYFKKLKSGERNVITLESLKEKPLYLEEAMIDDFTLKMIQKPLSEIERLVRNGECYIGFKYAWHERLKRFGHQNLEMIDYLVRHEANVNNRGHLGVTALMYACRKKDDRMVSFFLEHGAEVNQQNFFGSTALHYFITVRNFKPEKDFCKDLLLSGKRTLDILRQHKPNFELKNSFGLSAVDLRDRQLRFFREQLMSDRGPMLRGLTFDLFSSLEANSNVEHS